MLLTSSSTYIVLRIDDIRSITWLRFEMQLTSPLVFLSSLLTLLTTTPCVVAGSDGTPEFQNNGDSMNSLIRQKRVINRLPGQDVPFPSSVSSHTVSIKLSNHIHCTGTVLSMKTVITAARCVPLNVWMYKVFAGSTDARRGSIHNVTEKRMHGNHPVQGQNFETGIALIYVHPSFQPNRRGNIEAIGLHVEPLLPGITGMVRGWGSYYFGGQCETRYKGRLRAIEVPIMTHRDCVNSFQVFFEITDEYFCTHDINQQCAYTDTGAGFIIENKLAGIYIGFIETEGNSHLKPDVYIMVQHSDYHQWILRNIEH